MRATLLLTAAALCGTAFAQDHQVFFVPSDDVESWCPTATACCAKVIDTRTVAHVEKGTCQDCARKLTPLTAWNTLVGDENGDALYHRNTLFGGIDALLIKPEAPYPDMRRMFISVSEPMGIAVSSPQRLRPGDVAAIVRDPVSGDGHLEYFLRAEQVRAALGLAIPLSNVNVDAIAMDDAGNVFLSLEGNVVANLMSSKGIMPFVLEDGGIAVIPAGAITFDTSRNVTAVVANRAMIVAREARVDSWVANARSSDATGTCITAITDLDALEIDPNPGTLAVQWDGTVHTFPNLAFAGLGLRGLGTLTSAGGGQILTLGPKPCWMARSCMPGHPYFGSTQGFEIGVQAKGGGPTSVSINALAIRGPELEPDVLLLDTCDPIVSGPTTVTIGDLAGTNPRLLVVNLGPSAPGGVAPSMPSPWGPNPSFPDLYAGAILAVLGVPPSGEVTLGVPAGVVGNLVMQQIELRPTEVVLSTPMTLVLN